MYVYIRVYTLLVYIHVYIGQNQVYITTLVTMASKEELLDKSFNKITNNHYECIHCGMHLKSSGILRRCAHLAG